MIRLSLGFVNLCFLSLSFLPLNLEANPSDFSILDGDFRLIDSNGEAHALSYYSNFEAVVLLAFPANCQQKAPLLNWFAQLEKKMKNNSRVTFLWLNPELPQDRALVNQSIQKKFKAPVLMDFAQTVSKSFGFKKGGDYTLIRTGSWERILSGNWLDGKLEIELEKISGLQGLEQTAKANLATSCDLNYQDFSGQTWNPELAQKFFRNCVACHMRSDSIDFFQNDESVFNWTAMNRQVTRLFRMPPLGEDNDPAYSNCTAFAGFRIRQDEQREIQNWLEAGSPHAKGGPDLLSGLRKEMNDSSREIYGPKREPDLIWQMKEPVQIHPSDIDVFQFTQVPGPWPKMSISLDMKLIRNTLDPITFNYLPYPNLFRI